MTMPTVSTKSKSTPTQPQLSQEAELSLFYRLHSLKYTTKPTVKTNVKLSIRSGR